MDSLGITAAVLPELDALRGVQQSRFHHRDVHGHTLEVLDRTIALQADPGAVLGAGELAEPLAALLAEPLADELTRGDALRWGALLHDAAKPLTARRRPDGRVTFLGHDARGAELARSILERLRASERLRAHVAALVRHHLRLGFLVHEPQPLARRIVFAYLQATSPVEVDVTLLSVADRLATRGDRAGESIDAHLRLARPMLADALRWRADGPPRPLWRGDELAARAAASLRDRGSARFCASSRRRSTRARSLRASRRWPAHALFSGAAPDPHAQTRNHVRQRERTSRARAGPGACTPSPLPATRGPTETRSSPRTSTLRADDRPDCIFCKILAGELPATIVDEDERTVAFMDINPATRGHALVIPRAHAPDLLTVDSGGPGRGRARLPAPGGAHQASAWGPTASTSSTPAAPSPGRPCFTSTSTSSRATRDDPLRLPWVPAPGDPAEIAAAAQELAGAPRI